MEFLKPKGVGGAAKLKQQLLTVGDAAGNLHVYDVPQNLWRPLANERAIMSYFLEREIKVFTANPSIVASEKDLFNGIPLYRDAMTCLACFQLRAEAHVYESQRRLRILPNHSVYHRTPERISSLR